MTGHYHELESFEEDADGWWVAVCDCGWSTPGCPEAMIAAQIWGDHREAVASEVTE